MKTRQLFLFVMAYISHVAGAALEFRDDTPRTITIPENVAIGTSVYQVSVKAGTVTYTLTDDHFVINSASGLIQTKGSLDYETKNSYELNITATESATPANRATLVLTVEITDLVEPTFSNRTYTATIMDNRKRYAKTASCRSPREGTILGTYMATFPGDVQLVYTIANGNTGDDFVIGEADGVIKVATDKTLDKTRTATYKLGLHATGNGETGTAMVTVNVIGKIDSSGTSVLSASLLGLIAWTFVYQLM